MSEPKKFRAPKPKRSFNPNFDRENKPVFEKQARTQRDKPVARKPLDDSEKKRGAKYPARKGGASVSEKQYPRFERAKSDGAMRLNRFIAHSGICSRREADELIAAGTVSINGKIVSELGAKVQLSDEVRLGGEIIRGEKKVYIVMNKPKGFVTSLDDPHHPERTVMDIIGDNVQERVYPVGRLDKNSLGVLLITNDGDLTKRLTHPSYGKKKIYQVTLDKSLTKKDLSAIMSGVELEDGMIVPDEVAYVSEEKKKEIGITIHSGRNRIVRRIFESLGYQVMKLDRVYFAGLTKQRMKRGQWRFLTPKEVSVLLSGGYE